MFQTKEVDQIIKRPNLDFSYSMESEHPLVWNWCSFRGKIDLWLQSILGGDPIKRANDFVFPACEVGPEWVQDGVFEVTMGRTHHARLFLWHVPAFIDEKGLPFRRGVIVALNDMDTMLDVGLSYLKKELYL